MDIQTLFGLNGKVALVTGGATGIGRMAAEALVRAGATVLLASRKGDACEAVAAQFGVMFVFGLAAVAPAVVSLLLMDTAMAVAARTMPQVNVFILSLPLKIVVGLTVMALTLPSIAPLLERVYESVFRYWERVLG